MDSIEISTADNGFVLRYRDPEITKANRKNDCWEDPYRSRVYNTPESLTADLVKILPVFMEMNNEEKSEVDEYRGALAEAFDKGSS